MGEVVLLRLEYDAKLIPAGGVEIIASSAAPVKHIGKDAAGHKFHEFALRQRGVFGEPTTSIGFKHLDVVPALVQFFEPPEMHCLGKESIDTAKICFWSSLA